jgi:hypothetical protein
MGRHSLCGIGTGAKKSTDRHRKSPVTANTTGFTRLSSIFMTDMTSCIFLHCEYKKKMQNPLLFSEYGSNFSSKLTSYRNTSATDHADFTPVVAEHLVKRDDERPVNPQEPLLRELFKEGLKTGPR